MKNYSEMTIGEQINAMRYFLRACEITHYMEPGQIKLLRMALDALEEKEGRGK